MSSDRLVERIREVDPHLWAALLVGLLLRLAPQVLGQFGHCIRDECAYIDLATRIGQGLGLERYNSWLWAPGYPYVVNLFAWLHNPSAVILLQLPLSLLTVVLVAAITRRLYGVRAARIALWGAALHPTLIYFSGRIWPETIYITLLVGAVFAGLYAREGGWKRGLIPGALIGLAMLFRGVALGLVPVFALAMLWPTDDDEGWMSTARARWPSAAALVLATALVVAPWSIHASRTHGGFILTDATVGQMAWQGNNTFRPQTWDWGLVEPDQKEIRGRPRCPAQLSVAKWNSCEIDHAIEFAADNPALFLQRVPVRLAQLFNPNSFLTRHVRQGRWPAIPKLIREAMVLSVLTWSLVILLAGTVGAWARARGPFGAIAIGFAAYNLAVIAALAGMSRFRLPLEPLWLIFAAGLLANPREAWRLLSASGPRTMGLMLTLPPLIALTLRYLPLAWVYKPL